MPTFTAAEIAAKVLAATTAAEGGDYATAVSLLRTAITWIGATPDFEAGGQGGTKTTFDREQLLATLKQYQQAQQASAGVRSRRIQYVAVGSSEDV